MPVKRDPRRMTAEERFDTGWEPGPGGCWLWTGKLSKLGYARFNIGDRQVRVHRYAYERFRGSIPPGMQTDHLCRVRHCVNPNHLEIVTNHQNTLRGESFAAVNAKKTHCPKGHPYDHANTKTWRARRGVNRICKTCANERTRQRYYALAPQPTPCDNSCGAKPERPHYHGGPSTKEKA